MPGLGRSPTLLRRTAVALAAVALGSCATDLPEPHDDAACLAALSDPDSEDAIEWFKRPFPGSKRVVGHTTDDGLAFATELQARGAMAITVVRPRTLAGPGSIQTADGLVVELPDDPRPRFSLFSLAQTQFREAGFQAKADTGQKYLFIPTKP